MNFGTRLAPSKKEMAPPDISSLSHGKAVSEKGFSVNKIMLDLMDIPLLRISNNKKTD